jgi:hypothetical protein
MNSSQLQNLSDNFNQVLSKYQDTYQKYIDSINSNDNTLNVINNSAFVSNNILSNNQNTTSDDCTTLCQNNSSCSGATFNSDNNTCILNSGKGNVINSNNSSAIVNPSIYYTYELKNLNQQLLDINKQIQNANSQTYSQYKETSNNTQQKEQILNQNYQILLQEREEIARMIHEFRTIDAAYDNGSINLASNYYQYTVLLIISVLLVFLLIKLSATGSQSGGGAKLFRGESLFLLGLMVLFLGLSTIYKNYNIYIFSSILVILYIIIKMKQRT